MASRKREIYQLEPRTYVPVLFMFDVGRLMQNHQKKLLVIKEICSRLQSFRPFNQDAYYFVARKSISPLC